MTARAPRETPFPLTPPICDLFDDMNLFFTLEFIMKRGEARVQEITQDHREFREREEAKYFPEVKETSVRVHIRNMRIRQLVDEGHRDSSQAGRPRVFYTATSLGVGCWAAWKSYVNEDFKRRGFKGDLLP